VIPAALLALHLDDLRADLRDHHVPNITALGAQSFDISSNGRAHAQGYSRSLKKSC
jgi:hypothetical protein